MTTPELTITRDGRRVCVVGSPRTLADRELLKDVVAQVISTRTPGDVAEIILNVEHAGYLDSFALVALVSLARKCLDVGTQLTLEGASEELRLHLRSTRIDEILGSYGARIAAARPAA